MGTRPVSELAGALMDERGAVVCSGDCDVIELAAARREGRFFVDDDGLGYVLRPKGWRELAEQSIPGVPALRDAVSKAYCVTCDARVMLHARHGLPLDSGFSPMADLKELEGHLSGVLGKTRPGDVGHE